MKKVPHNLPDAAATENTSSDALRRAERRTGELLKELARHQTAGLLQGPSPNRADTGPSPYARALADTGISTQSASRYQAPFNLLAPQGGCPYPRLKFVHIRHG